MRTHVLPMLLVMLSATTVYSQSPPHPDDLSAAEIGSFNLQVSPTAGSTNAATVDITVYRTSANRVDYVVDVTTIEFENDCFTVNQLSTTTLFTLFSQGAIAKGVAIGYTQCPGSCATPATSMVYIPACVEREGSGCFTYFTPCSASAFCRQLYTVCCAAGPAFPMITLVSSNSPGCGAGVCQSTCPCQ